MLCIPIVFCSVLFFAIFAVDRKAETGALINFQACDQRHVLENLGVRARVITYIIV